MSRRHRAVLLRLPSGWGLDFERAYYEASIRRQATRIAVLLSQRREAERQLLILNSKNRRNAKMPHEKSRKVGDGHLKAIVKRLRESDRVSAVEAMGRWRRGGFILVCSSYLEL